MGKINTRIFWNIFSNLLKQKQNFPVLRKHNFPTPVLNFRHSVLWVIELQFGRGSWADKQSQTTASHLNNICHKSYRYHYRYLLNASSNICVYLIYWDYSNSDQDDNTNSISMLSMLNPNGFLWQVTEQLENKVSWGTIAILSLQWISTGRLRILLFKIASVMCNLHVYRLLQNMPTV